MSRFVEKDLTARLVVHACNPNYTGGGGRMIVSLRPAYTKVMRLYFKNKKK
jgi:hypothetical protein